MFVDRVGASAGPASGVVARYEYTLSMLHEIPRDWWHAYEPQNTIRFFSLRLREAGMIRNSPEKLLADGSDWRFLNAIRAEQPAGAARAAVSPALVCKLPEMV